MTSKMVKKSRINRGEVEQYLLALQKGNKNQVNFLKDFLQNFWQFFSQKNFTLFVDFCGNNFLGRSGLDFVSAGILRLDIDMQVVGGA